MATAKTTTTEDTKTAEPMGYEWGWYTIQKPQGVTDTHQHIGFNDFEGQFMYDAPVRLPKHVVAYLRSVKGVEYRSDKDGTPVPSYYSKFSIYETDPPAEVAA